MSLTPSLVLGHEDLEGDLAAVANDFVSARRTAAAQFVALIYYLEVITKRLETTGGGVGEFGERVLPVIINFELLEAVSLCSDDSLPETRNQWKQTTHLFKALTALILRASARPTLATKTRRIVPDRHAFPQNKLFDKLKVQRRTRIIGMLIAQRYRRASKAGELPEERLMVGMLHNGRARRFRQRNIRQLAISDAHRQPATDTVQDLLERESTGGWRLGVIDSDVRRRRIRLLRALVQSRF